MLPVALLITCRKPSMVIIDAVIDMGLASVQRQVTYRHTCFDRFACIVTFQSIAYGFMASINQLQSVSKE